MVITQAILFVNEPCLLRRQRLDPGVEIQDVVFELNLQALLGGPGNVGLEDQALGLLVNVDRRRVRFPRRFERSALSPGAWQIRAVRDPTLTRIDRIGQDSFRRYLTQSQRIPRLEPAPVMPAVPAAVTVIRRGLASSAFGRLTVRIPSENEAPTWALSTRSGSVIVRAHRPIGRSCRR